MSNSEKILKAISNLIEKGVLTSKDIRKEISFTDPELSKNFNEIINPSTRKNDLKEETKEKSNESVEVEKNINQTTSLKKENLPTGLKHIKDNEEDEKENKES